ncbi:MULTISPECIES: ArsR/SmtB family transcription factor [Stenotrophomonas]|uniref:Transcriptional regulator n=1 Tax=Stenotrophomonas maltophilia TaxID=40324 RepID=A0A431UP24_STEMA|nr:metalloregulator ArsR/SmtB family transcription factor [Stenotrophomonas maltophilia]RTQ91726.1 transcriptional regulator [Stenotrophomonas maltophilia]
MEHDTTHALFSALGESTRRGIFQRLAREGEQTVGNLTEFAGISQPAVSKHLAVLKQAGLVEGRKDGRETYYQIAPGGLSPLVDWLKVYSDFWNGRLDALSSLLDRMDS